MKAKTPNTPTAPKNRARTAGEPAEARRVIELAARNCAHDLQSITRRTLRGETLYRDKSFAGPVSDRYAAREIAPEERGPWEVPPHHRFAVVRDGFRFVMTTTGRGDAANIAALLNAERRREFEEARVIAAGDDAAPVGDAPALRPLAPAV